MRDRFRCAWIAGGKACRGSGNAGRTVGSRAQVSLSETRPTQVARLFRHRAVGEWGQAAACRPRWRRPMCRVCLSVLLEARPHLQHRPDTPPKPPLLLFSSFFEAREGAPQRIWARRSAGRARRRWRFWPGDVTWPARPAGRAGLPASRASNLIGAAPLVDWGHRASGPAELLPFTTTSPNTSTQHGTGILHRRGRVSGRDSVLRPSAVCGS